MRRYRITVMIDGHWGTRYRERIVEAWDEEQAEALAERFLNTIETRYDEDGFGAYEEATVEDIRELN